MFRPALASLAALALSACAQGGDATDSSSPVTAVIETSEGDITLALDAEAAPVTVANFVALAGAGAFDGTSFYRTVRADNDRPEARIDVIQGGAGFDGLPDAETIAHERSDETGLSHTSGAISMARDEPGTASSEFFIVITDSLILDAGPNGRHPDGEGFAAFGYVTAGMNVAEVIWRAPTGNDSAPEGYSDQWLTEPVRIERVRIIE